MVGPVRALPWVFPYLWDIGRCFAHGLAEVPLSRQSLAIGRVLAREWRGNMRFRGKKSYADE